MATIQRKDVESGFQASELKSAGVQPAQPAGFESGIGGQQPAQARPVQVEQHAQEPLHNSGASAEAPAKKRYYSPREVMKKRGCIGCGGMTLALPVVLIVLAVIAAF